MIWLRFGSLDSMEEQWHSSSHVFQMTGLRPSAQYKIIKRWLENGKQVVSLVYQRGRQKMLTYQQRVYIANPKTLMEMRHLSLEQRLHC